MPDIRPEREPFLARQEPELDEEDEEDEEGGEGRGYGGHRADDEALLLDEAEMAGFERELLERREAARRRVADMVSADEPDASC